MDDARLPLTEHLEELRRRIVKSLAAWVVASALAWAWAEPIFGVLLRPAVDALGHGRPLQAIAPTEIFFTYLKCALLAGFVFSLPVVFWQAWAFVAPGLYPAEKRWTLPFVIVSSLLFAGGASFGYQVAFPLMFEFFASFDSAYVQSAWTMSGVFSLVTQTLLAFGAAFEIPIVVFFLAIAGVVDARTLWRKTPYAILVVFVVAAIVTPSPDWLSQVLVGVPMVALYLLGVAAAYLFGGSRARGSAPSSEVAVVRTES